jgi:hypothetical protein
MGDVGLLQAEDHWTEITLKCFDSERPWEKTRLSARISPQGESMSISMVEITNGYQIIF